MKLKLPKNTQAYIDQHGKARFYLRRPGHRKVPLPGLPWSPEFMTAREAALKGEWGKSEIGAKRTVEGTVSAALVSYYQSNAFKEELAKLTQQNRRAILEAFRAEHGDKRIGLMHEAALQVIVSRKRHPPNAISARRCAALSITAITRHDQDRPTRQP